MKEWMRACVRDGCACVVPECTLSYGCIRGLYECINWRLTQSKHPDDKTMRMNVRIRFTHPGEPGAHRLVELLCSTTDSDGDEHVCTDCLSC